MNVHPRLAALLLAGSLAVLTSCGDDTPEPAGATLPATTSVTEAGTGDDTADSGAATTAPGSTGTAATGTVETLSVEGLLSEIGPDGIEQFGGEACAREFAEIAVAAERYIAREGAEPESLDSLVDDLAVDIVLWEFDEEAQELVPTAGSPCVDFRNAGRPDVCAAERQTLEIATEAYTAQYGRPPASQDELVPELLREPIEVYDLDADGSVVPAVGGPCDTVP